MGVSGIGAGGFQAGCAAAYKTGKDREGKEKADMSWTVRAEKECLILHGEESEEDGKLITATVCAVDKISMSVYQPKDFDPANPVYKVKAWDAEGNMTERMVDISKVNPGNCDRLDMYAYSAYLSESGKYSGALHEFISSMSYGSHDMEGISDDELFSKKNWLEIVGAFMRMQYRAGNLKGYMDLKRFWDILSEKKEESDKKAEEESKVETDICVKPDGSKVLVMTRMIGGMTSAVSIKLSEPAGIFAGMSAGPGEAEKTKKEWAVPDISDISGLLPEE